MRYNKYKFDVPDEKIVRLIMNSDAKNEADDQFAIVQALLSPKIDNVGLIAAHYGTKRHMDSMERSYREIETIFDLMNFDKNGMIYKGAHKSMQDELTPVDSEGARFIIKEAMKEDEKPLYIAFMGPLTDMASAYLIEPKIKDKVIVIWIGGGKYPEGGIEFNLQNDIHAANVVFGSGMELWQIPKDVYEMMPVSFAELELRLAPHGAIGSYLFTQLNQHTKEDQPRSSAFRSGESWVLGDTPAIGMLLYEHRFEYMMMSSPYIEKDYSYKVKAHKHQIRVYQHVDSRLLLEDLYAKVELFAKRNS